jgi:GNAT superfamily N-acetyltransferase
MTGQVRRAVPADAAGLVRLRALMLAAMGPDVGGPDIAGQDVGGQDVGGPDIGGPDAPWRSAALAWFGERLAEPGGRDFAAFVVDAPDLGVVSCAVGLCDRHAPGPATLSGRRGHVFNVSTDPGHRGLGHARACLVALLAWFDTDAGVAAVDLNVTGDGVGLYTSLGFAPPRWPALRRQLTGRPGPVAGPAGR